MFRKRVLSQSYNEHLFNTRTYVNGETAIKPYYYLRNGLLHVRYTVDRCVDLSASEVERLKAEMTANPSDKQGVLSRAWSFFTVTVDKPIIADGIAELEKRIKGFGNGCEN